MVMAKKKTEDPPDEKAKPVMLRLPESLLERLDAYRDRQRFPPSRQIVIERLIEGFLKEQDEQPEA